MPAFDIVPDSPSKALRNRLEASAAGRLDFVIREILPDTPSKSKSNRLAAARYSKNGMGLYIRTVSPGDLSAAVKKAGPSTKVKEKAVAEESEEPEPFFASDSEPNG